VPLFDHIGITVDDLPRAIAQFDPVMQALGCTRQDADNAVAWSLGEEELILFPARESGTGSHRHGRVGWQHLAFPIDSRAEVDRLHAVALDAGWTAVSGPKLFPRFNDRYYASFVEDDNGIRLEFMHNPPREPAPAGGA
jgi:catechol 2,3-dioxygenase-like lactoylglutathione lyase family enzyme